ncbi:MAG: hypothetical protein AAB152_01485 [Candidatus Coatesbacteria bacterium]
MADGACPGCSAPWTKGKPEFRTTCPACGAWMHVCINCRHYDPHIHHECRAAATAEYVADKEKFNYCEEFVLAARPATKGGSTSRADAEKKLFG